MRMLLLMSDDQSSIQLFVPYDIGMNFNNILVLACLYMYYKNPLMTDKYTVCYNV